MKTISCNSYKEVLKPYLVTVSNIYITQIILTYKCKNIFLKHIYHYVDKSYNFQRIRTILKQNTILQQIVAIPMLFFNYYECTNYLQLLNNFIL